MKSNLIQKLYSFAFLIILIFGGSCKKESEDPAQDFQHIIKGWKISETDLGFNINNRAVHFINAEIGYLAGYNGEIYKTTNAGKAWEKLNSGTTLHLFSVFFLNENVGFAGGEAMTCLSSDCGKGSVFLKTIDGGATWTKQFFPDFVSFKSIKFVDSLNGLALIYTPYANSRNCAIAKTTDGGITWNLLNIPVKPAHERFYYVDNTVLVAGENQQIFKSKDFGLTWQTITTPVKPYNDIRDLHFYDENTGFVDGVTEFFKTTDGGLTWNAIAAPFTQTHLFHFFNEHEAFNFTSVISYDTHGGEFKGNICFNTFDGGLTWEKSELKKAFIPGPYFSPRRDLIYVVSGDKFYTIQKQ